ncbi:hypothetical protein JW949_02490 [Candidatus Woesearchaeota archaeon]|nr:hypothetical protein [Candidatus Woesearchaeota archaeon]
MIINSLELKNIRSYENETIKFPESSFLILGDIGSGKTSLLLAIEFAIFGLRRGELAGSGLLRHGKKQGSVKLSFSIGNKKITIKRTLKKTPSGIQQDSGHIVINGKKTEGSALELKSKIFNLLGYPEEMVSKSKSLIYRYTVYTPQEMMNSILIEDKDERLNTLRKIFDIDKYKTIKENAVLYIRELKNKKKNMDEKTESLNKNMDEFKDKQKEIEEIQQKIETLNKALEEIKEKRKKTEDEKEKNKERIKKYHELKQELFKNSSELNNKKESLEKNNKKILNNKQKNEQERKIISSLKIPSFLDEVDGDVLKKKLDENLGKFLDNREKISRKIQILETRKDHSQKVIRKITDLNKCPTCLQDVDERHKKTVKEKENNKIKIWNEKISFLKEKLSKSTKNIDELKKKKENLIRLRYKTEEKLVHERNIKERDEETGNLINENIGLKKDIDVLEKKRKELEKEADKYKGIDEKQNFVEKKLSEIIEKQKNAEIKRAESGKEKESLEESINRLNEQIRGQEKIRQNIEYIKQLLNWLEDNFIKLMSEMEKNILMKIYHQFNEYFTEWFHVLIEEEELQVRLNEDFSPVITQNGYETNIDNLSGGEKTSLALSYRLALNQVINDFITRIKTKNLIILDEPTDGFSNTQLDKIKDIIDSLKIKQIIIISHDNKIEGYVDNILKIEKHNHLSHCLN